MVIPVTRMDMGSNIMLPFKFYLTSQYSKDLNQVAPVLYSIIRDELVTEMHGK